MNITLEGRVFAVIVPAQDHHMYALVYNTANTLASVLCLESLVGGRTIFIIQYTVLGKWLLM